MVEFEHFVSCSLAVLWAIMAGHSRNSTSVFSAPVGWSITTQYSVCSSLICRLSTLSLSRVFYFLIAYLWQQNSLLFPSKNRQSCFCIYSELRLFVVTPWFPFSFEEEIVAHRWHKNPPFTLKSQTINSSKHKTSEIIMARPKEKYYLTINLQILGACVYIIYAIVTGNIKSFLWYIIGQFPRTCDVEKQEKQESSHSKSLLTSN